MAKETPVAVRDLIVYSVYIRNHTEEGTFRALIPDLDRIKALGTDVVWLMPIHPIGEKGKKGSLGCPYANRDYRTTNPAYGTMEDFRALCDAVHERGMKIMIDVVYNHTSPDATLVTEHPEFYYRKPDGSFGNKTADWTDVIDLDYDNRALWDYQIESLKQWASMVDGFRCDVASLVPTGFWCAARAAVKEVNPDCLWLAESVHASFVAFNRSTGNYAASDAELYEAFDIEYEYDIREIFDEYTEGKRPLKDWLEALNRQEIAYPANYSKLRCLENHDMPRAAKLFPERERLVNHTAMLYFMKGTTLLYGGQEYANSHLPSLFEKDVFSRETGCDLSSYLTRLGRIKKTVLEADDCFRAVEENGAAVCTRVNPRSGKTKLGVFCLAGKPAEVTVDLADGTYENVLGGTVTVAGGKLSTAFPVILAY
ncbi:MAG: alpha-amylase family glycosyl hydrolase [Clostridia bacterium]|nr:alpha-amylase family glycosyl hydrolase [Clostridia bacterium]